MARSPRTAGGAIGTLRAENAALEARTAAQALPEEPPTSLRRLWTRWWLVVAVLVALVVARGLLAWSR